MTRVATVRRIGIFGGTFDPVHLGHLILAEQCREQGRLDEVWFVPAGNNPFKSDRFRTFDQRAEMVELAIAGHAAFKVNRVEKEMLEEFRRQHPAEPLPASYTYQTLAELHRRDPADELFLLIGSDSLEELPQWREPQQIARNAGLLAIRRNPPPRRSDCIKNPSPRPPSPKRRGGESQPLPPAPSPLRGGVGSHRPQEGNFSSEMIPPRNAPPRVRDSQAFSVFL